MGLPISVYYSLRIIGVSPEVYTGGAISGCEARSAIFRWVVMCVRLASYAMGGGRGILELSSYTSASHSMKSSHLAQAYPTGLQFVLRKDHSR